MFGMHGSSPGPGGRRTKRAIANTLGALALGLIQTLAATTGLGQLPANPAAGVETAGGSVPTLPKEPAMARSGITFRGSPDQIAQVRKEMACVPGRNELASREGRVEHVAAR